MAIERVKIHEGEARELVYGLKALANALKRAAQLGGALELETDQRDILAAQQKQILSRLEGQLMAETQERGNLEVAEDERYAARVAVRLRLGHLYKTLAAERRKGLDDHPDIETKTSVLKKLAPKLGVTPDQLNALEALAARASDDEGGDE